MDICILASISFVLCLHYNIVLSISQPFECCLCAMVYQSFAFNTMHWHSHQNNDNNHENIMMSSLPSSSSSLSAVVHQPKLPHVYLLNVLKSNLIRSFVCLAVLVCRWTYLIPSHCLSRLSRTKYIHLKYPTGRRLCRHPSFGFHIIISKMIMQ